MAEPLKNAFDAAVVEHLANAARATHPTFDTAAFAAGVLAELDRLELKDRINLLADQLRVHLPEPYPEALRHVVAMAAQAAQAAQVAMAAQAASPGAPAGSGASAMGMAAWPLCSVVERHGVDHPAESLAAMTELTQAFSCEFAIRPFLEHHLDQTLAACRAWVAHPHPAVRRLASEGTRPRLPWGPKVAALLDDPGLGITLVTELRHDPDEVVRRSVANHLNDVARTHPDRVAALAADWLDDPDVDPAMVRHALRTLVKQGHPGALAALGFATDADGITVEGFTVEPPSVRLGDTVVLRAGLRVDSWSGLQGSSGLAKFVVDFVVHHVGARGGTTAKVFKWTTVELGPGDSVTLEKKRLIQTASTRRYHAGRHRVELQVAGHIVAESGFDLLDSSEPARA